MSRQGSLLVDDLLSTTSASESDDASDKSVSLASTAEPALSNLLLREILDISPFLQDAGKAIVDDSFLRCFQSNPPEVWSWNLYLFVWTCLAWLLRKVLFVIKLAILICSFAVFMPSFFLAQLLIKDKHQRNVTQAWMVHKVCQGIIASWFGVIKYHGPRPSPMRNHIWVANHTSMIDYAVVCAAAPFACIMQLHPSWMGWMQKNVMSGIGCVFFNREEAREAKMVKLKMKKHVEQEYSNPLIIFPEGTCTNNEYVVMFKAGAFDIGATVCPIAIKYNKLFSDTFWNSKREGFMSHLFHNMHQFTVVADVYFLEPQDQLPGESAAEFADRVRRIIAKRAGLKIANWDGMYKYKKPHQKDPNRLKFEEKRTKRYTDHVRRALPAGLEEKLAHLKQLVTVQKGSSEEGKPPSVGPHTPRAISPVHVRMRQDED